MNMRRSLGPSGLVRVVGGQLVGGPWCSPRCSWCSLDQFVSGPDQYNISSVV